MGNKYTYKINNIKNDNKGLNDYPAATFNLLLELDRASSQNKSWAEGEQANDFNLRDIHIK